MYVVTTFLQLVAIGDLRIFFNFKPWLDVWFYLLVRQSRFISSFLCSQFILGLDKLRASEPASHASRASESCESCESSCEPCETDVSSQSVFLSSAFFLLAIWHEFSLSSLSFCYLPSSFSSFGKVSFVLFCCR